MLVNLGFNSVTLVNIFVSASLFLLNINIVNALNNYNSGHFKVIPQDSEPIVLHYTSGVSRFKHNTSTSVIFTPIQQLVSKSLIAH